VPTRPIDLGDGRYVIYADGVLGPMATKTVDALLRYWCDQCVALIHCGHAGEPLARFSRALYQVSVTRTHPFSRFINARLVSAEGIGSGQ